MFVFFDAFGVDLVVLAEGEAFDGWGFVGGGYKIFGVVGLFSEDGLLIHCEGNNFIKRRV